MNIHSFPYVSISDIPSKLKAYVFVCQQIPIDIFEGLRDDQALEMAKNLEFKGPQLTEVRYASPNSN